MEKNVIIMPCLDMQNGRVVKGVHFVDIADAGDPVECAKAYCAAGADELALLDITATVEKRGTLLGVASSLRVLGIMLSSLLCGGLICIAGSVRIVFAGAAVLFLILLGLVCWTLKAIKKLEKQQKKSEIQQEGDHL